MVFHQMIENKRYCMDIVNQIKAIKSSLTRVETKVLEKHLRSCVTQALNKKDMEEKISELVKSSNKLSDLQQKTEPSCPPLFNNVVTLVRLYGTWTMNLTITKNTG